MSAATSARSHSANSSARGTIAPPLLASLVETHYAAISLAALYCLAALGLSETAAREYPENGRRGQRLPGALAIGRISHSLEVLHIELGGLSHATPKAEARRAARSSGVATGRAGAA